MEKLIKKINKAETFRDWLEISWLIEAEMRKGISFSFSQSEDDFGDTVFVFEALGKGVDLVEYWYQPHPELMAIIHGE